MRGTVVYDVAGLATAFFRTDQLPAGFVASCATKVEEQCSKECGYLKELSEGLAGYMKTMSRMERRLVETEKYMYGPLVRWMHVALFC